MKDLTKYFINLSKLSEEQRKEIAKLILIKSGLSMSDYLDLLHGKIDEPNGFYLLEYAREQWHLSFDVLKHKTELTYPEFIKLFEGGESKEVLQVENNGWIKFENEKPNFNDYCYCWLLTKDGEILLREWNPHSKGFYGWREVYFTHYQPIQKPEPPKF